MSFCVPDNMHSVSVCGQCRQTNDENHESISTKTAFLREINRYGWHEQNKKTNKQMVDSNKINVECSGVWSCAHRDEMEQHSVYKRCISFDAGFYYSSCSHTHARIILDILYRKDLWLILYIFRFSFVLFGAFGNYWCYAEFHISFNQIKISRRITVSLFIWMSNGMIWLFAHTVCFHSCA